MSYAGTILDVQDKTSKDGTKHYWAVEIDTEAKGPTTFTLWDAVFAGKPGKDHEEPICNVRQMIGQRVVFDCQPGKPRVDKDGNETGEHWPATLTMIGPSVAPKPLERALSDPGCDLNAEAVMVLADALRAAGRTLAGAADVAEKVVKGTK